VVTLRALSCVVVANVKIAGEPAAQCNGSMQCSCSTILLAVADALLPVADPLLNLGGLQVGEDDGQRPHVHPQQISQR
jgi:hypothetical protein